ncbi:MAG: TlpA family protein disulfide reductase [Chloroflexota bacterium]
MDPFLLLARLVLAAVFLTAGVAKLLDAAGTREAVKGFGTPLPLVSTFAATLPVLEVGAAVLLVPVVTSFWGAAGTLVLLLAFLVVIAANLARGNRPECRCFGSVASAPIGAEIVVRNLVLVLLAACVSVFGPGVSLGELISSLTPLDRLNLVLLLIAVLLAAGLARLIVELLRQNGRLLLRVESLESRLSPGGSPGAGYAQAVPASAPVGGLPIGAALPQFELPDESGAQRSLRAWLATDRPTLLFFTDPQCGACAALLPEMGRWRAEHAEVFSVVTISREVHGTDPAHLAEHGLGPALLQRRYEMADAFKILGTPSAVLVRPDGTIGSAAAAGADAIRELIDTLARTGGREPWLGPAGPASPPVHPSAHRQVAPARASRVGEPAPPTRAADLNGQSRDLAEFAGFETLVIFWNPDCGFCREMLPDLKALDDAPVPGSPRLLVVSNGSVEANRALDLRSPVLIDQGSRIAQAYDAGGTPMAVLVDSDLRIASDVAIGAPQVLALAGRRPDVRSKGS